MVRISKEHVLFGLAGVLGCVAIVLTISPSVPDSITGLSEVFSITGMSIIVFLLISVIVFYKLVTNGVGNSNRPKIERERIEESSEINSRVVSGDLTVIYWKVLLWLEESEEIQRRTAMYGRRVQKYDDVPIEVTNMFEELSVTAVEGVMIAEGCEKEEASEKVRCGEWCENRRANAFLAIRDETECEFTVWERLFAWVSPKKAFERNVEEVMEEVEMLCGEGLTFEQSVKETNNGENGSSSFLEVVSNE